MSDERAMNPGVDDEPLPPDEEADERAQQICAHLLIFTYLRKSSCKDLVLDEELRARVRARLRMVGLELVDNVYSEHFAVRLLPVIESDVAFDWSTNSRLNKGAVALLVILWSKLILPKRVAQEQRLDPDDENMDLFQADKPRKPVYLTVHRDALYAEFGAKFGKVNFTRYLGQLRNMGFVSEDRAGNVGEGPLLDLLVDGTRMAIKLKDSVLWSILHDETPAASAKAATRSTEDEVGFPEGVDASVVAQWDDSDVPSFLDEPEPEADPPAAPEAPPEEPEE